ncbi:rDNA transcriptional regulator pol5-like protein [Drosera capensis]
MATTASPNLPDSMNPMEKRKKRKLVDKERHHSLSETKKTKQVKDSETPMATAANSFVMRDEGMPGLDLRLFTDLASAEGAVREAAAGELARQAKEIQRVFEEKGGDEEEGVLGLERKDDGFDECAPTVRYAVRRLVRGVSSSREFARQGFALGLTVVVGAIRSIRVDSVLKLILQSLEVTSSMKGQEAKDCFLGRLFAYGALARSGRLAEEWDSDRSISCLKDFTSHVISLASKKRYLQEPAVCVLEILIEKLPADVVVNHVLEAPGLKDWFEGANDAGNPDALLLALKMCEKMPTDSKVFGKLLPYPYCPGKFFTSSHLSSIINCFKESTFCQPRVHGVWPLLVGMLLPEDSATKNKKPKKSRKSGSSDEDLASNLKCFCDVVLDGSLLSSSHDRKHLAFEVVILMLPRLPASYLPIASSQTFVQCLIDILSSKDSWLFKVAENFLKNILDWIDNADLEDSDKRRVYAIVALQKHINGSFDFETHRRTIKDLLSSFKTYEGCDLLIKEFTNMFLDEVRGSDEPSDQSQTTDDNSEIGSVDEKDASEISSDLRRWVIESIQCILKGLSLDREQTFKVQKGVMKFLAVQGLFSPSLGREVTSFELQETFKWPKGTISSDHSRMCVEQLQLLFSNASKLNSLENDLGYYFVRFFGALCGIPTVSFIRRLSDEEQETLKGLQAMESQLYRQEKNCEPGSEEQNKLRSLRYLLIQLLPQLVLRPGDMSETASELIVCCRKLFATQVTLDSSGEDETGDDGSPNVMDVLVDTLLSLLPQESAPMRYCIEQVFRFTCKDVTQDGVLQMMRVIKKDLKPPRHKVVGSNDSDSDSDDDFLGVEADESDEAETPVSGVIGNEKADGSEAVSTIEAETSEDSDEESGDEKTDDMEPILDMVGAGDNVDEASNDSDEGMDDEAMFRMDHIAAMVLQEKKGYTESQLMLFKLRVLSLVEIYVGRNPGKPQVISVFSNLVQAFLNLDIKEINKQLGQKMKAILRKIFEANDYPKGEAIELSTLESLLEKNLTLASRAFKKKKAAANISKEDSMAWNRFKMIKSLGHDSTYWILKIIDGKTLPVSELTRVLDIFKSSISAAFESKKFDLKPGFLKEVFKRRPWLGQQLLGFLVEKRSGSRSEFWHVEALELLLDVIKPLHSRSDSSLKGILERHLPEVSRFIGEMVLHISKKKSRWAEARKSCRKVFQILAKQNMMKPLLENLEPETHAACESLFREQFLASMRG